MLEDRFESEYGFGGRRNTGDRKRRLEGQLSYGKGSSDVAGLAYLAVLLVERLFMPMHHGVKAKCAHHKNERNRQKPLLGCLRHRPAKDESPALEDSRMRAKGQ